MADRSISQRWGEPLPSSGHGEDGSFADLRNNRKSGPSEKQRKAKPKAKTQLSEPSDDLFIQIVRLLQNRDTTALHDFLQNESHGERLWANPITVDQLTLKLSRFLENADAFFWTYEVIEPLYTHLEWRIRLAMLTDKDIYYFRFKGRVETVMAESQIRAVGAICKQLEDEQNRLPEAIVVQRFYENVRMFCVLNPKHEIWAYTFILSWMNETQIEPDVYLLLLSVAKMDPCFYTTSNNFEIYKALELKQEKILLQQKRFKEKKEKEVVETPKFPFGLDDAVPVFFFLVFLFPVIVSKLSIDVSQENGVTGINQPIEFKKPKPGETAIQNLDPDTPLIFYAVAKSDTKLLEFVLKNGEDPNQMNKDGDSPLIIAVRQENLTCVSLLLQKGADPNKTNLKGISAISTAEEIQNPVLFNLLRIPFQTKKD